MRDSWSYGVGKSSKASSSFGKAASNALSFKEFGIDNMYGKKDAYSIKEISKPAAYKW